MNGRSCLVATLIVVALLAASTLAYPVSYTLPNTCAFGNNYIQLVGFTCVPEFEIQRNPSYDGVTWAVQGEYNTKAFKIINKNMNKFGIQVGATTYCANFTIVNSGCSSDGSVGSYARTISATWAQYGDFFFSSYGSTLGLPNMQEVNNVSKIIFLPISSASTNFRCSSEWMAVPGLQDECRVDGQKRFKYAYAMLIPAEYQLNPAVTIYKLAGVKKVVFWNEQAVFPQTVKSGVMLAAQTYGIDVVTLDVPLTPTQAEVENLVAQIKEINPDGVISAAYAQTCPLFVAAMRKLNYVPPANTETDCVTEPTSPVVSPDAIYGADKTEYDRRMTGPSWTDDFWYPFNSSVGISSPQLVYDDIVNTFGVTPHWSIPITIGAGYVLHTALQKAGSLNPDDVAAAINLINQPSFIGQIGFSQWGQNNVKDVIVLQADQNFNLQIVYPLGSATANFIYPAPTFAERVFKPNYMGKASEQALAGIVGALILISIGLLIFVIVCREEKAIIAASPVFLATILIGSIMLYGSYYAWVLQASTAACYLRFWLIGMGFVTMFGALFAKTWRIMRIFTQSDLRVFRITNLQLVVVLAVLLGIEAGLLAIWSGTSRPARIVKISDPLRPSTNMLICSNGKSGKPMLGILVAYKLIIVLYGIYMSIRIWKIPLKQFNESRSIAFSMYNMLCFGILAFALQVSGSISDPAMFIVRSVCLALSTFFTILAIFGPKILHIITGHTGYTGTGTGTNGTNSGGSGTGSNKTGLETMSKRRPRESSVMSEYTEESPLQAELRDLRVKYMRLKEKYAALSGANGSISESTEEGNA